MTTDVRHGDIRQVTFRAQPRILLVVTADHLIPLCPQLHCVRIDPEDAWPATGYSVHMAAPAPGVARCAEVSTYLRSHLAAGQLLGQPNPTDLAAVQAALRRVLALD